MPEVLSTDERVEELERKLKLWQKIVLGALSAAGISIFGIAKGLYERGSDEGVQRATIVNMNNMIERNREDIAHMRDQIEFYFRERSSRRFELTPGITP